MVEATLLALLVAKIRKYKITPLFKDWAIYPALIFSVLYIVLQTMVFLDDYRLAKHAQLFSTLYLCTFLVLIFRYKQYLAGFIGAMFIITGTILNNVVMAANGGKMPVFATLSNITGFVKNDMFKDSVHIFGDSSTKLKFLSDIFDVGYCIYSLGDVLVCVFAFIVVLMSINYINAK